MSDENCDCYYCVNDINDSTCDCEECIMKREGQYRDYAAIFNKFKRESPREDLSSNIDEINDKIWQESEDRRKKSIMDVKCVNSMLAISIAGLLYFMLGK